MIGCPVRNRAWILPEYLRCLENLDYPEDKKTYCFIVNDCQDETPEILMEFAQRQPGQVSLVVDNSDTGGYLRGHYSFRRLAYLRNLLLREFLRSECDLLFSIDSDILVPPDALRVLISHNRDIVSCLVCNGKEIGDLSIYNVLCKNEAGHYIHMKPVPRDRLFRVDCTGAAYLIRRQVLMGPDIRYSDLYGAEDIGFCESAARQGVEIYCDGRLEVTHVMKRL